MKLRNKKTGEIVVFGEGIVDLNQIGCKNVAEMMETGWEDYDEEPKDFWFIGEDTRPHWENDIDIHDFVYRLEQIGNYFETKEEAEKAVEKLKAWKRLKDVGCRFVLDDNFTVKFVGPTTTKLMTAEEGKMLYEDYRLLFGGEEEDE